MSSPYPFGFRRCEPTDSSLGFVDRWDGEEPVGFIAPIPDHTRTPHAKALREMRCGFDLGLGETARGLGLTVVQLSELERGAAVVDDWPGLYAAVLAIHAAKAGRAPQSASAADKVRIAQLESEVFDLATFHVDAANTVRTVVEQQDNIEAMTMRLEDLERVAAAARRYSEAAKDAARELDTALKAAGR